MNELEKNTHLQDGKYKIEKSLGQGGFGITYLAEQTNLGRKVCIKEFFMKEYGERTAAPEQNTDETVLTGGVPSSRPKDEEATVLTGVSAVTSAAAEIMGKYREKFVKEARTIARLDHPGIVRIHDVFEENGTAYYVMDFIEGENLNDMVKREGPLSEGRALGYIRQIADALSYVHDHKIMHLDVKPANVLVRKSDDKAILIDFGTAKQYDSEGTQTSTTPVGLSVGYAPIEMTKPGGVQTFSPETDVYSLGATLYYLVTGQNPPDASERMEMIMDGEEFKLPETLSATTVNVIEQSMQARKKRIQTVSSFLDLLDTDQEKERLEAERKAAAEAEAKRQEELRLEREKEEAERKRIAEEKAKKETEEKTRKEVLEKADADAKAQKKEKTDKWLIGLNILFFIAGLVMLVLAISCQVWYLPTSFDPFGYIGFGLLCTSSLLSVVCISRKSSRSFSWATLTISLIVGFVCLYDAVDEDSIPYESWGLNYGSHYYDSLSFSTTGQSIELLLDSNLTIPSKVYIYEGRDNETPSVSTITQSKYLISNKSSNNAIYYSILNIPAINGSFVYLQNLKPETTYSVYFEHPGVYYTYGLLHSFHYHDQPDLGVYKFVTSSRSGVFRSVTAENSVYKDGVIGMRFHVSFDVYNCKGEYGLCSVYFFYADGTPLKAKSYTYSSPDGNLGVAESFVPKYDATTFNDFVVWIPYSELTKRSSGNEDYYYVVELFDYYDGKYNPIHTVPYKDTFTLQ